MTTRPRIQAEQSLHAYTRRHKPQVLTAMLGNNAGTVDHPTRGDGWVYIRLHGDRNQRTTALDDNNQVAHTADLPVTVEWVGRTASGYYRVLGLASSTPYPSNPWTSTVGVHAAQHQRRDFGEGGNDVLDVYNRALINLRARAQATPALTLYVERGFYINAGIEKLFAGGNSGAFSIPAGTPFSPTRRTDLLYINTSDALAIATGAATTDGSAPTRAATPADCCYPLAYVRIDYSLTAITEDQIEDARAGNTSAPTPHTLGSHSDSPANIANGFLKRNAANAAWEEVAYGSGANTVAEGNHAHASSYTATAIGQMLVSLDGTTFVAKMPVTDAAVGWLVDGSTGYPLFS